MQGPAGVSQHLAARMGIPDFLLPLMPGKLKVFLVIQSQHLGPFWGFLDASVLSTSEQSQGFGSICVKGFRFPLAISWGILPRVVLE